MYEVMAASKNSKHTTVQSYKSFLSHLSPVCSLSPFSTVLTPFDAVNLSSKLYFPSLIACNGLLLSKAAIVLSIHFQPTPMSAIFPLHPIMRLILYYFIWNEEQLHFFFLNTMMQVKLLHLA